MSIKVMTWVWENAPVAGTELLLLLAVADHADDTGRNAFPSRSTLAAKTRLDERTVRRVIRRLETGGHLHIEHRTGRGHSNRYAIPMDATPPVGNHAETVHSSGEEREADRPPGKMPRGAAPPERGALCPERGVTAPPDPSLTVREPSTRAGVDARARLHAVESGGGGEPDQRVTDVLAGLGSHWRLTTGQRRRIEPKLRQALDAGWTTPALIEHLSANPDGVKSAPAVLAARLDDLPPPETAPQIAADRPTWCGACEGATRHIERADGRLTRCPDCHPLRARSEGESA